MEGGWGRGGGGCYNVFCLTLVIDCVYFCLLWIHLHNGFSCNEMNVRVGFLA